MSRGRDIASVAATALFVMLLGAGDAGATPHRHHRDIAPASPPRPPTSFYPQNVDGGVAGNLSFNNQIRKFRDPLNANGGR